MPTAPAIQVPIARISKYCANPVLCKNHAKRLGWVAGMNVAIAKIMPNALRQTLCVKTLA